MADAAVRTLERAVAQGDAGARVPLATAYLRQGRAAAALALLEGEALSQDGAEVHEAAWRRELEALEPAGTIVGARAGEGARLVGWFGPAPRDDRFAVVTSQGGPRLIDVDRCEVVLDALPADAVPAATSRHAVFCWLGRRIVRLEPPTPDVTGAPWRTEEAAAPRPFTALEPSPDGARLLVRDQETHVVGTWPDLEILQMVGGAAHAVDWAGERAAWWQRDRIFVGPLRRGEPPRVLDLARALDALPGARRPTGAPAVFELLDRGLLIVGPPLVVLDLATGRPTAPAAPGLELSPIEGPFRRACDGELLLFVHGEPSRAALSPDAAPPGARAAGPGRRAWHPFAAAAACGPLQRGLPEVRGADGETVRLLPRDAEPLGWSPDGRTLLVLRRAGATSALERWVTPSRAREPR